MTYTDTALPRNALPQLYQAANEASLEGQRRYKNATRLRLWLAVVVSGLGTVSWPIMGGRLNALAACATLVFSTMLLVEIRLSSQRPDRAWFEGRAVAESVKTLAWKFAVAAEPFPSALDPLTASQALVNEFATVRSRYVGLALSPIEGEQVTSWMLSTRTSAFEVRRETYIQFRLREQQHWYSERAQRANRSGGRWRLALLIVETTGIALSFVGVFVEIGLALASLLAVVVAAAVGWMQIQQFDQLGEAYSTAVADLADARTKLQLVHTDEGRWAREVSDAEEAMSREHTLWSAKRSQVR